MKRKAQAKRMSIDKIKFTLPDQDEARTQWIISHHAYELARLIKDKQVSCVEVMTAYAKRTRDIGRQLNLTADELWEEAFNNAQAAD